MANRLLPEISASERLRFFCTAIGFMCVAASALIARTAGDALFLSRFDASLLPWMYCGSAVIIMLVSYVYSLGTGYLSIGRLTIAGTAVLILMTAVMRLLLTLELGAVRVAAYFLADLLVNLPMLLFWGLVAYVFDLRESKRLLGLIGSAGTGACILFGLMVGPIARRLGVESLFIVVCVLLTVFLALVAFLASSEPHRLLQAPREQGARPSQSVGQYASLLKMQQLRNLAFYTVVMTMVLVTVDFVFKYSARQVYEGAELAGFFGTFYGIANIAALSIQLFAVHRILNKLGLMVAILILPVAVTVTSAGLALTGAFRWVLACKAIDPILNFSINSAATQMLYLGIKKQSRSRARAFVEGVCKPLAMALAGAILVIIPRTPQLVTLLAHGILVVALIWLVSAWRNHRAFMAGLIESVGAKTVEFSHDGRGVADPTLRSHFQNSLLNAADEEVPYLAGLVTEIGDIDVTPQFRQLLLRPSPAVKVAALTYLRDHGGPEDLGALQEHIQHDDASVRLAAVHAAAACAGEAAVLALEARLEDADPAVRAATAAELINIGDLDAFLAAGTALKEMLRGDAAASRAAATSALSYIRTGGLTRLLGSLLADPDDDVRTAALVAFGQRPSPQLISIIVGMLDSDSVGEVAADTLVRIGPSILPHLEQKFEESRMTGDLATVRRIPDVVARLGTPAGIALLRLGLTLPHLRVSAVTALCKFIAAQPSVAAFRDDLDRAINQDIEAASIRLDALAKVPSDERSAVLRGALEDELTEHTGNVFRLLDVREPSVNMNALFSVLGGDRTSNESRGQALEVLDNVLETQIRPSVMRLVERPATRTVKAKPEGFDVGRFLTAEWSDWVVIGALYCVAEGSQPHEVDSIASLLEHTNPVVRETALYVLTRRADSAVVHRACTRLHDDHSPIVRRLVVSIEAGGDTVAGETRSMSEEH